MITPALEAEAAPILATLPEPLAAQLVRELIRLRSPKVDSGKEANELLFPIISHSLGDGPTALRTHRDFRGFALCPRLWSLQKTGAGNSRR